MKFRLRETALSSAFEAAGLSVCYDQEKDRKLLVTLTSPEDVELFHSVVDRHGDATLQFSLSTDDETGAVIATLEVPDLADSGPGEVNSARDSEEEDAPDEVLTGYVNDLGIQVESGKWYAITGSDQVGGPFSTSVAAHVWLQENKQSGDPDLDLVVSGRDLLEAYGVDGSGRQFSDYAKWLARVKQAGLKARAAPHPDTGEEGQWIWAQDTEGNERGWFDMDSYSGVVQEVKRTRENDIYRIAIHDSSGDVDLSDYEIIEAPVPANSSSPNAKKMRPVKNAYQKSRVGDWVAWEDYDSVEHGTILAKGKSGFLTLDTGAVFSGDVIAIYRPKAQAKTESANWPTEFDGISEMMNFVLERWPNATIEHQGGGAWAIDGIESAGSPIAGATFDENTGEMTWTDEDCEEVVVESAVSESYQLYHDTYSAAVQAALEVAEDQGYEVDEDDYFQKVAVGPKRPAAGKTNSISLKLHKDGKEAKQRLHLQVYNMDDKKYELNCYVEGLSTQNEAALEFLQSDRGTWGGYRDAGKFSWAEADQLASQLGGYVEADPGGKFVVIRNADLRVESAASFAQFKSPYSDDMAVGDFAYGEIGDTEVMLTVEVDADASQDGDGVQYEINLYALDEEDEWNFVSSVGGIDGLSKEYLNSIALDLQEEYAATLGESFSKSESNAFSKARSLNESFSINANTRERVFTKHLKSGNVSKLSRPVEALDVLESGVYHTYKDYEGNTYFERKAIRSDDLLRFDDDRFNSILEEINAFWKLKDRYESLGLTHKRGILLYGTPGTGKSCLIKQVVEDAINSGNIVLYPKELSGLAQIIREFRDVEPDRHILVVLEDVDGLIQYNEHALLELFDGDDQMSNVCYLATTNYPDRLPARVTRSGRFDTKLEIKNPPKAGRLAYLQNKLKDTVSEADLDSYADLTEDFSFGQMREFLAAAFAHNQDPKQAVARIRRNYGASTVVESRRK